ncbi:hamartin [Ciona intestinalis]
MASSLSGHLDMAEIYQLLDSTDLSVLEQTTALVRDNLGSVREPWLLHGLVDYYIQSGNIIARNLLCMVRQHQHKMLMNKMDDYLQKVSTRFKALCLFGHIVRSEPIWTPLIISTRPFQTVLKCLQVDTDLPTITSALYTVATLLPKVASQLSTYLHSLFRIYVRLVSWHTLKPAGANEANLIHLHTAVYALFLCLYGMFPCSFIKFLQQYYQPQTSNSSKGGTSEKEKSRIFENSVQPMLDHVRLHPRIITDSSDAEISSDRWRKLEGPEIIADINRISLDATENSAALNISHTTRTSSSDTAPVFALKPRRSHSESDQSGCVESLWSPSVAIGLSTPPPSRKMSPTISSSKLNEPFKFSAEISKVDERPVQEESVASRPSTLSMANVDGFIPNRPHQTASATSTPLKHFLPSLVVSSPSPSIYSSPKNEKDEMRTQNLETKVDSFVVITNEALSDLDTTQANVDNATIITKTEDSSQQSNLIKTKLHILSQSDAGTEGDEAFVDVSCSNIAILDRGGEDAMTLFSPGLQPADGQTVKTTKQQSDHDFEVEVFDSAQKVLNLPNTSRYIEKSPNELLDLHVQLLADAYMKYKDRISIPSNKEMDWRPMIDSSSCTAADAAYLRSQVLQMHCVMLYERHRREQHVLRARKLQRKVYDTEALEETNQNLKFQVGEMEKEIQGLRLTEKVNREKIMDNEKLFNEKEKQLKEKVKCLTSEVKQLKMEKQALNEDHQTVKNECQLMRSEHGHLKSKLFESEQLLMRSTVNKKLLDDLQFKVTNLESELTEARELNCSADVRVRNAEAQAKAEIAEAKLLSNLYAREETHLKEKTDLFQTKVDFLTAQVKQLQSDVNKKEDFLVEQKKYLEDVKSLARVQIHAMEAKYTAQRHISQRLEIQVLELYSKLSAMEGEMTIRERTHLGSAPRSIEALSAIQAEGQHHHILGSSPQLSPPIRSSGHLSDAKQWSQRKQGM